jgi:hypothetical protein
MRKLLSVVIGFMVAGALVAAQAPKTPSIKKVQEEVTFSQDVKVGATVLKAGHYQVSSSKTGDELTFRRRIQDVTYPDIWNFDMKEKPVVVKCTVTALPEKSRGTQLNMPADSSGIAVLKTLTLDDTNLTFTIAQ